MQSKKVSNIKLKFVRGTRPFLSQYAHDDRTASESQVEAKHVIRYNNKQDNDDDVASFYREMITKNSQKHDDDINRNNNNSSRNNSSSSSSSNSTTHSQIGKLFDRWSVTANAQSLPRVYHIEPHSFGYRSMVTRMKWDGAGLGKEGQGRLYPVPTQLKFDRSGVGRSATGSAGVGARITHDVVKAEREYRLALKRKKQKQRNAVVESSRSSSSSSSSRHHIIMKKKRQVIRKQVIDRQRTQYFRSLLNGTTLNP